MGEINITHNEKMALKAIDFKTLDELLDQAIDHKSALSLRSIPIQSCGEYVSRELFYFEKALADYSIAKSAKKCEEARYDARRMAENLKGAFLGMKNRMEIRMIMSDKRHISDFVGAETPWIGKVYPRDIHHHFEAPVDYVSRLAVANGFTSLQQFLEHTDVSARALVACDEGAISKVSDWSGLPASELNRWNVEGTRARIAITERYLKLSVDVELQAQLVRRTHGATGADIERWAREARRIARNARQTLTIENFLDVLPPIEKLSKEMLECVAIHELGHAITGLLLDGETLLGITIEDTVVSSSGRQPVGGAIFQQRFRRRRTRDYYLDQIAINLGGIAAETLFFGTYADGAGGKDGADLHTATNLAIIMERHLGMGEDLVSLGDINLRQLEEMKLTDKVLMERVGKVLAVQFERAKAILQDHKATISSLVERLLAEKALSGKEIQEALFDQRQGISKGSKAQL